MTAAGWPGDREGARSIGEVLKGLLRRKKFHEKGKYGALVDAWAQLVGDAIASRTRIRSFKGGELVIEVDSPVLLHELNSFRREQLLEGLQAGKRGRDVAKLRLCLGVRAEQSAVNRSEEAQSL